MSKVVPILGLCLLLPACSDEPPASPDARGSDLRAERHVFRALWVLCEGSARTLEDPARIDRLIEHAQQLEVTDLFVQVYRGGRSWYDASLADPAPYREIVERTGGDPLRRLLEAAHAEGLRVHAWVNVLSLNANRSAPILTDLGREATLVDRRGRTLLDYPGGEVPAPDRAWYRMGTPGLYLDPGAPGVRERLVETFSELVDRYPELDGLHLDYIRYPGVLPFAPGSRFGVGLDFGYGAASRKRFRAETGLAGPYRDPSKPASSPLVHTNAWDEWRRAQVTDLVQEIRVAVLANHVDLLLSAAVVPYADRAYLSLAQDWRAWVEDGLLDFAVLMIYTRDDRLFRYQVESFARSAEAERLWMGSGSWLFAGQPERAVAQLATIRAAGSTGEAIFSYDALLESDALMSALVQPVTGSSLDAGRAP
ncbi:MAG: family 10 glycosylhydrolase [Myxococcota bacterium]|nr:family 10 glycosylhydrolase [Myxococcota bacterium]